MKTRNGFVSNSSTTSFVIEEIDEGTLERIVAEDAGEGWGYETALTTMNKQEIIAAIKRDWAFGFLHRDKKEKEKFFTRIEAIENPMYWLDVSRHNIAIDDAIDAARLAGSIRVIWTTSD